MSALWQEAVRRPPFEHGEQRGAARSRAPWRPRPGRTRLPETPSSGAGDFPELVGLDDVALLEVLEIAEADAAFEALLHLAGIVLEPLERGDRPVPDDDAVAQEPDPPAPSDHAVLHVAAGHPADTRDGENLADLVVALDDFLH